MYVSFNIPCLSCLYIHFRQSYGSAKFVLRDQIVRIFAFSEIPRFRPGYCRRCSLVIACSTSHPSGNLVDGLPLVAHTGEYELGPRRIRNYVGG